MVEVFLTISYLFLLVSSTTSIYIIGATEHFPVLTNQISYLLAQGRLDSPYLEQVSQQIPDRYPNYQSLCLVLCKSNLPTDGSALFVFFRSGRKILNRRIRSASFDDASSLPVDSPLQWIRVHRNSRVS